MSLRSSHIHHHIFLFSGFGTFFTLCHYKFHIVFTCLFKFHNRILLIIYRWCYTFDSPFPWGGVSLRKVFKMNFITLENVDFRICRRIFTQEFEVVDSHIVAVRTFVDKLKCAFMTSIFSQIQAELFPTWSFERIVLSPLECVKQCGLSVSGQIIHHQFQVGRIQPNAAKAKIKLCFAIVFHLNFWRHGTLSLLTLVVENGKRILAVRIDACEWRYSREWSSIRERPSFFADAIILPSRSLFHAVPTLWIISHRTFLCGEISLQRNIHNEIVLGWQSHIIITYSHTEQGASWVDGHFRSFAWHNDSFVVVAHVVNISELGAIPNGFAKRVGAGDSHLHRLGESATLHAHFWSRNHRLRNHI